jgi:hypothetical protein
MSLPVDAGSEIAKTHSFHQPWEMAQIVVWNRNPKVDLHQDCKF